MNSAPSSSSSGAGMGQSTTEASPHGSVRSVLKGLTTSSTDEQSSPPSSSKLFDEVKLPSSVTPSNEPSLEQEANRYCTDCQEPLPATSFSRVKVGGRFFRVRQCHRCRSVRNFHAPFAKRNKEFIDEKLSLPCRDCGQTVVGAMVFDYVAGPRTVNPASAWRSMSLMNLQVEVSFCDVVCANCATRRRRARLATPPPLSPAEDLNLPASS
jgi:hypothetical protein